VTETRPNILWVCTDQQRFDTIAAMGNEAIRTPHLDRLVQNGVGFDKAYCQSPICTPSRVSFLTGCYPTRTHVHRNGNRDVGDIPPLVTRILADAGYDCGLIGKLHLSSVHGRVEQRIDDGYRLWEWSQMPPPETFWPTEEHFYQRWLQEKGVDWAEVYPPVDESALEENVDWARMPEGWGDTSIYARLYRPGVPAEHHEITWAVEKAIDFIREDRDGPWMLSINSFAPHPPTDPPAEYLARMDRARMPRPAFEETDRDWQRRLGEKVDFQVDAALSPDQYDAAGLVAAYYAEIELIDEGMGRLLDALEAGGQLENTLIVFTSDHGEMLGDHGLLLKGCRFYEGLVRVPLVFSWPAKGIRGVRSDALVELVDIAPTLLEAAGIEVPEHMQGRSLHPILTGTAPAQVHKATVRCEYHDAVELQHASHATMIRDDRFKLSLYHGTGLGELYDLDADPHEHRNLWDDPAFASVRASLTARLLDDLMTAVDVGGPRVGRY
jgi:arylsulfatase A-like enzyme